MAQLRRDRCPYCQIPLDRVPFPGPHIKRCLEARRRQNERSSHGPAEAIARA